MLPNYFIKMDAFPYTPNGKIDKRSLPLPKSNKVPSEDFYVTANDDVIITYADYSCWEFNRLKNGDLNKAKEFWVDQFKGEIPVLDFGTDFARPNSQSFEGEKIFKTIDKSLTDEINNLAKKFDVSSFMLLLAAYYVLLFKYSNEEDIVVGTPVASRDHEELSNMIGMFVNTLALKGHISPNMPFKEFLKTVKETCLKAFEYQDYPFDLLVNDLGLKKDASRNPLFCTMFIYQNTGISTVSFDGIKSELHIPDTKISKFDFSLELIPQNSGELTLNIEYCTKLFKRQSMESFAMHFINILKSIILNPDSLVSDIEVMSDEEKNQILYNFNNTKFDYPSVKTIYELFEEQVKLNPDKSAVVFEDKKLTFKELKEHSYAFAKELYNQGLRPKDTVSIRLERSLDLIISIFACVKLGVAYVLIEKTLPSERVRYIIENSNSKAIITSASLNLEDFGIKTIIYTNSNETSEFVCEDKERNDNLCIIYTSGSTGMPKGVLLTQKGFVNLVFAMDSAMSLGCTSKFVSHASVSFDMFAFELYCSLLNGKTLYLTNDVEQKDPISISNLILKNNIDFMLSTPSKIELILTSNRLSECLSKIKVFLLGGEVFTSSLYTRMKNKTTGNIYNGYGPTEITACCSVKKIENPNDITIGKPVNNTEIYILDNNLSLCPAGVIGELCVAGDGLADGYINNKERTDNSFVYVENIGKKVYKTGDLAKINSNRELEYIGRRDFQVKLHGQRIELRRNRKTDFKN